VLVFAIGIEHAIDVAVKRRHAVGERACAIIAPVARAYSGTILPAFARLNFSRRR
jgi:hypothetical protein